MAIVMKRCDSLSNAGLAKELERTMVALADAMNAGGNVAFAKGCRDSAMIEARTRVGLADAYSTLRYLRENPRYRPL